MLKMLRVWRWAPVKIACNILPNAGLSRTAISAAEISTLLNPCPQSAPKLHSFGPYFAVQLNTGSTKRIAKGIVGVY